MTPEEFLINDHSYKLQKLTSLFICNVNTLAKQREAYESGVKVGWKIGRQDLENTFIHPNNRNLSLQEYNDIMLILKAFGYTFSYIHDSPINKNIYPGLNIFKNIDNYNRGLCIQDTTKEKIIQLIKEDKQFGLYAY